MIEYIFAILLVITGFFLCDNKKNQYNKTFWIGVIWVYLTLLIGLRFQVGGDTLNYMGDWQWSPSLSEWSFNLIDKYQPGFTLLFAMAKSISPEFFVFQLIHAAIVNTLLFIFINRYTRYFFASLLSIFFTCYLYFSTEILREVLAVLIFALNYRNFAERKWIHYYCGILICCCFHISAIFLVLLPLVKNLKVGSKYIFLILIVFLLMIFLRNILDSLTSLVIISEKVSAYKDLSSIGLLADFLNLTRYSIFPIFYICIAKYLCKQPVKFETPIVIMSLFGIAAFFSPIIFSRATNYFILFFSISIADFCVNQIKKKYYILKQYSVLLTLLFFSLYGSNYIMYHKYTRWIPYCSIFNPIEINRDNYSYDKF